MLACCRGSFLVFWDEAHVDLYVWVHVLILLVSDFLQQIKLLVNSCICNLIFSICYITVYLSFLLFFFSQGHLFSVCACHPSPTSSYFTWCDSEVWVVVTTEDTGPSLFYLRSFCCCKHIAHLLLG